MPSFLIFCHRFFELRFITATGILEHLSQKGRVTLMLPASLAGSFKEHLPENVSIETADYKTPLSRLQEMILNFLGDILYLTFPNTDKLPNATAKFHRDYYTPRNRIIYLIVVSSAILASKNRYVLRCVRAVYQALLPKTAHQELISEIKPDLMIGCSFGLGIEDAAFLQEARHNNIRSAVVVQTWDRSSNKGYPTVHPDYALVWSEIMKTECLTHLDFRDDNVIVTGSPLWDTHFNKLKQPPDPLWRKKLGVRPETKILFYACGEFRSHPANMLVIPQVMEMVKKQIFQQPVHLVFRPYPLYMAPESEHDEGQSRRRELEELLERYQDDPAISVIWPDFKFDGENFLPTREDQEFMTECLYQCDVSISMVSSQMIEACLFDKPAINLEYGLRIAEKYEIELSDYRPEHLLRIYRTGAIYRVHNHEELENAIRSGLSDPAEKRKQRQALIEQEAKLNQGAASIATAETLARIARGEI